MPRGANILNIQFAISRFAIYQAICERLEAIDRTMDAGECFRQMVAELVEQANANDEQSEWIFSEYFHLTCRCH